MRQFFLFSTIDLLDSIYWKNPFPKNQNNARILSTFSVLNKGQKIGHYKILSTIGAGGMGEVYLAEDTRLDRKVAVKFLNEEFSRDANKLKRFIQEAKAASALNHPNILTVYEISETDGTH